MNALEADELEAFEAHRAMCPTCSREVAEFCETAPMLAVLADAPPPPPALRATILSSLDEVRQLPALHGDVRQARPPVVDELVLRRSSRRTRVLSVLVAAVSVVALALGAVVYSLGQQQAPVAGPSADTSLLAAPDAQIVPMVLANGAQVSFVVSKSQNRALFVGGDLPSPGRGKTYELWTMRGQTVMPDNLVDGGTNVSQWLHGPIRESTEVAVSIEEAGGSVRPTAVQGVVAI